MFLRARTTFLSILVAVASCTAVSAQDLDREPDVPYIPTPLPVVEEMLRLADLKPGELLYDLGSGDGRFVITAAQEFGARGVGIDIDASLVEKSRENARQAGVEEQVRFVHGDIYETDFSDADVVTLFLLTHLNIRLRPQLFEQLRPGTRIVSHLFDMGDWEPDRESLLELESRNHELYLWILPADMKGIWLSSWDGLDVEIELQQQYQEIDGRARLGETGTKLQEAALRGKEIRLVFQTGGVHVVLEGEVNENVIEGEARFVHGDGERVAAWRATRASRE